MTQSTTVTRTQTFSRIDAKRLASNIVSDLERIKELYACEGLTNEMITDYEFELIEFISMNYLNYALYGFKRNGKYVFYLKYLSHTTHGSTNDDPGGIKYFPCFDKERLCSFLSYNQNWHNLTRIEQEEFESNIPIKRVGAEEPNSIGEITNDRQYSSGGRHIQRNSFMR